MDPNNDMEEVISRLKAEELFDWEQAGTNVKITHVAWLNSGRQGQMAKALVMDFPI
ncbi:hypothetical protein Plec18170_009719, partial [Paecilomyces lecythidis]